MSFDLGGDHHNFDLDQLLIGVILLSIVVFLLPSLFMFYSCFTCSWLLVLVAPLHPRPAGIPL